MAFGEYVRDGWNILCSLIKYICKYFEAVVFFENLYSSVSIHHFCPSDGSHGCIQSPVPQSVCSKRSYRQHHGQGRHICLRGSGECLGQPRYVYYTGVSKGEKVGGIMKGEGECRVTYRDYVFEKCFDIFCEYMKKNK